jgi:membrane associated rhomboid family serine protease
MNDAAVGFQCPSCVAEGRKSTRSGRTPYGGLRPTRNGLVSQVLIAINVGVWLLIVATGWSTSVWVDRLGLRPKGLCVAGNQPLPGASEHACTTSHLLWLPGVSDGAWWQPLTTVFTHEQLMHIGFNMLALWILGPQLELMLGRLRYVGLYLLSGLLGSAVVYAFSPAYTLSVGASGAIFGLMGALLVLTLKVHGDVGWLLGWIGISVAYTLFGVNISWQAHLGGFLGGCLLALVIAYAPRPRRNAWQAAGFTLVALLVVVTMAARTAALT